VIARHKYSEDESDTPTVNVSGAETPSKRDEWNHMQQELRLLHLSMLNYALERGYSDSRWQLILNMLALFKDEDNIWIQRTHVINMYGADFNLMLGLKWRVAV
jgi:hypothetical protein